MNPSREAVADGAAGALEHQRVDPLRIEGTLYNPTSKANTEIIDAQSPPMDIEK